MAQTSSTDPPPPHVHKEKFLPESPLTCVTSLPMSPLSLSVSQVPLLYTPAKSHLLAHPSPLSISGRWRHLPLPNMSHLNDKVVAIPPFRPSPDILQNHRKRWHSLLTTRLLIVFKALKRQFRTISPNGSLETWMYMGIFSWMVAKLRQHWYTIDPVANVASRLYYEFQLGETSNEHSWITHWISK